MFDARALRNLDWVLLLTVLALTCIGIGFIWSSTHWEPGQAGMARQQFLWLGISLLTLIVVLAFDYARLAGLAYPVYAVTLVLLVLVLTHGAVRNHARRWLTFGGYQVQPSELAKVAVVLALARYLMYRRDCGRLRTLVAPFVMTLVPMGLILLEPDLGTALVFVPTLFVMLYVAGASARHLAGLAAAGAACMPLLWFRMGAAQQGRVIGFLWPASDPFGTGWHLRQSLAAVASGGMTGAGFSSGSPVILNRGFAGHTDFIFATIANEWGFLGALAVLLLFFMLLSRGVEIAAASREPFGRLVVAGILTTLAFQALVNIGMTVRLCPITGITLPFVSYGGSSLVICFIMAALVLNVGMRRKPVLAP